MDTKESIDTDANKKPKPIVTRLSEVKTQPVEWLWSNRIARGKLTLLDGDPGLGKSTLTLAIAAAMTTGQPMPGESISRPPGNVLLIAVEDGVADTIQPRLKAAGADLDRVFVVGSPICLRDDLDHLRNLIVDHEAALVIIDPLMAVLGADASSDQKVRSVLTPLGDIANCTGAAILMVRHLTKGGGKSALHRGGGSMGIMSAARSALLFARDPDNADLRVLAVTKSNLGPKADSIRLSFETQGGVAAIRYVGAAKQDADALLTTSSEPEKRTQLTEAIDVLRDALAQGPVPVPDLQELVRGAGLSWGTARRAQVQLGIISEKAGFSGGWQWRLPEGAQRHGMSTFASGASASAAIVDGGAEDAQPQEHEGVHDAVSTFVAAAENEQARPLDGLGTSAEDAPAPSVAVHQQMLL